MITLACLKCRLAMRTVGEAEEVDFLVGMKSDWYPDRYPCPRSGCSGKMTLTDVIASDEIQYLEIHDLSPQEVFQALQGMGLPEERLCTVEAVKRVFEQKVVHMDVQPLPGTNRCAVRSFTVADGTRIYIASSPFGAVFYRIAPPRSLTNEVLSGN